MLTEFCDGNEIFNLASDRCPFMCGIGQVTIVRIHCDIWLRHLIRLIFLFSLGQRKRSGWNCLKSDHRLYFSPWRLNSYVKIILFIFMLRLQWVCMYYFLLTRTRKNILCIGPSQNPQPCAVSPSSL